MVNRDKYLPLSYRGFAFEPFQVRAGEGAPLARTGLPGDLELLVFSRGGESRALIAREMAYHHVAQGELAGEPYVVSF